MDELVAWLRAQLDEDERVARAAIADDSGQDGGFEDADWLTDVWLIKPRFAHAAAAMIRRFAVPRSVLAEVEAKRRVLALHTGAHDCTVIVSGTYPPDWPESASYGKAGAPWAHATGEHFEDDEPCPTVLALAQPCAGQPGWREEWRLSRDVDGG